MHSKSPGNPSTEDDIEMIGLEDIAERSKLLTRQNGTNASQPRDLDDSDDEDNELGDDGKTLLSSHVHTRTRERISLPIRVWPQIRNIVAESAFTLLITTVGLLFTGKLLEQVARWRAMKEVHQLIIIIPVILNLKGNLEMNLSARLGTAANIGDLDDPARRRTIILGNLSLLQVQAAVVSFVAAFIALVLGLALHPIVPDAVPDASSTANSTARALYGTMGSVLDTRRPISLPPKDGYGRFTLTNLVMVASTAMTAASLSSIVLGSFMCILIVLCRRYGRDPDNIGPPVATCLGDLVTLCFMGLISTLLIRVINTPIPFILGIIVILFSIVCFVSTIRNDTVRPLLTQGWFPLFGAMLISSGTGIVLDRFVSRYVGFALLSIVNSGLPGSVGSILVSRLSTSLHVAAMSITPGAPPNAGGRNIPEPSTKLVMMTLLFVSLPIEILFLAVIRGLGWLHLPIFFVVLSFVFFFFAVLISLYIARILTNFLWSKQRDPDMYALPIHSALMDLIGQLLLVICFEIAQNVTTAVRMRA